MCIRSEGYGQRFQLGRIPRKIGIRRKGVYVVVS